MNTRRILAFFLVVLLLTLISYFQPHFTGQAIKQAEYPKETAILERVIDGDTIVYRIGNITQHCRLLGINNTKV